MKLTKAEQARYEALAQYRPEDLATMVISNERSLDRRRKRAAKCACDACTRARVVLADHR